MFEYLKGKVAEKTPANIVLDVNGVGYVLNISLYSYARIEPSAETKIYVHFIVREDEHILFGFSDKEEREIFRHLISVSGVGPNTARMILSSLNPAGVKQAIASEDLNALKGVKGIGLKTAQRVIVDLKDKMSKFEGFDNFSALANNTNKEEALSALVALGFDRASSGRIINKLLLADGGLSVEELVKQALKQL